MKRKSFHRELEHHLGEAEIMPLLPCALGSPEPIPVGLVGSNITAIGSIAGEQSGLVIEYCEKDSGVTRRVFLGFSDCGMIAITCVSAGNRL